MFKAREEYELPCGCLGVWRRCEKEPGVREFVVVCPRRISAKQSSIIFDGVWELRHKERKGASWYVLRALLLQVDFEECESRAGVFHVPTVKPGPTPRSSKVKEKDPGARLKFHNITF